MVDARLSTLIGASLSALLGATNASGVQLQGPARNAGLVAALGCPSSSKPS